MSRIDKTNLSERLDAPLRQEVYDPRAASGEDSTVTEATYNTSEVEEAARTSLNFLAGMAMPLVFKYFFPEIFLGIWNWLVASVHRTRDFSQLAIGLPRGFGKTMLIKIFILYSILFTKKKFILIICGTQTKANNIITDVVSMLEEFNIKKVFGDWRLGAATDRQDMKRFGFRGRNIILMGAGAQSDIRGITLENERPDLMIFDDIQTREDADSEIVSKNLETWMVGTAMKAKSPHGCLFVFIANMYPTKHSLLRKLKANPTWDKFICGGILDDGTSLWEDLQPIKQLIQEYANDLATGRPEIFFAEVLNDENATVNNLIDISKIPKYEEAREGMSAGNFIIIDPSNDKRNSDAVTIMYFEIHNARPVCKKIIEGRLSPGDTISEALKLALSRNCRLIAIESTAYQYSLLYWFNYICLQKGITGIEPAEIYSGQKQKVVRIMEMFKQLLPKQNGEDPEIQYIPECSGPIHSQIVAFNPLRTDNVDGVLDCLTYAPKVIELYGHFIVSNIVIEQQEYDSIPVRGAEECSAF